MNEIVSLFYSIGEPYAAGLFENPDADFFYRHACAHARFYEHLPTAKYDDGENLYPHATKFFCSGAAVIPDFARTYAVDWDALEAKSSEACRIMREFAKLSYHPGGWTHAAPNYKRILKEGLASYRERILARPEGEEFREGLLLLINSFENYINRSVSYLKQTNAPKELISALEKVPFAPADTYYEGLVSWNMIFYFDGCDNLGCLDDGLAHLYKGEDLTHVIHELFENIDLVGHWSCTIGPNYNYITRQALRAIGKLRRPMLELMTKPDMPEDIWELAIQSLNNGSSHPSFYNAVGIHDMLSKRFPHIPDHELDLFCGCGCTETNLQGLTRAGGTDDNTPLAKIFEEVLHSKLASCETFEEFYEEVCTETERRIDALLDYLVERYEYMGKFLPNPTRSIFTDDCIDNGVDFNAGGARYTWIQSSDSGLINTIDSLLAVRELVYRKKMFTAEEFTSKLTAEDPVFYKILSTCPCYGVDNDDADSLAHDYAKRVYSVYHNKPPKSFIDAYLITEHQFRRYGPEGSRVGATPDGRHKGEPLCDSIASIRGKAVKGPTAMLKSASRLPQNLADGISVLNLTLQKNSVNKTLRALVDSYFAMGGIQVQVTVTSAEELRDAMEHPERHGDLIVRVGGYSEYFVNLTPELKRAVLERNIHELA